MKKWMKTAAAFTLALTVTANTVPANIVTGSITVHAEGGWSKFSDGVTTLGTSVISAPKAPEQNSNNYWTGSYVYYGQYGEGMKRKPVKYRVLDPDTTVFGGRTMFLDCNTTLFADAFRDDSQAADATVWAASDLYKVLNTNDDAFLNTSFTSAEANAIAESTRDMHKLVTGYKAGNVSDKTQRIFVNYTPLTGEKIFLLDAEDASNTAYGYNTSDGIVKNRGKSSDIKEASWWLRSTNNTWNSNAGYVENGLHQILEMGVDYDGIGVSPAFNVSLSSVMFASQVNDETGKYGKEYKLTVKDPNTTINPGTLTRSGDTVTVPYTVTDSTPDDGITADTVSVLITDADGALKYYAPLKGTFAMTGGSGTFNLPAGYAYTDTIYILAEDTHDGDTDKYLTDYASEMVKIDHLPDSDPYLLPDPNWSKFSDGVTTLGTSVISAPKPPEHDTDAWQGSYVYYGQYDNTPVKYRVLDPFTYVYGGTTMLLDCDTTLFTSVFNNRGGAFDPEDLERFPDRYVEDAWDWGKCDLRKVLNTNDDAFLYKSFTRAEATAIADSIRAAHKRVAGNKAGNVAADLTVMYNYDYTPLNGDKIFLLDFEDVSNIAYGYSISFSMDVRIGVENRKKKKFTDPDSHHGWWLRSQGPLGERVGGVKSDYGYIDDYDVTFNYIGVSPAFNVDLSSVMFASQVNDETGKYGKEYKLTVKDANTTITPGTVTRSGDTMTVKYTVTDSTPDDGITANTVSVLITDADGALKYYAPLTGTFAMTGGSGTFDLPAGYADTDSIYILAEDVNAQYLTDYASEMVKIYSQKPIWSKFADGVTTLGTSGISAPKAPEQDTDAWQGSYVYYGQYNNKPVKYRVLDPNTSVFGGTTMLLDCDTTLFTSVYNNRERWYDPEDKEEFPDLYVDDPSNWKECDLRKVLNTNADAFLKKSFTRAEATAIANSKRAAHPLVAGNEAGNVDEYVLYLIDDYTPLTGEKIFLLDFEEISNIAYGYSISYGDMNDGPTGIENRKKKKFTDPDSYDGQWWLRSPSYMANFVSTVNNNCGNIYPSHVLDGNVGVSPAFNVSLSSVMFASQLNDETGKYGKEYKLTVKDANTTITPGTVTRSGDTVTVRYTVTDSTPNDGITADTVSVLITDADGAVKYYAPLTGTFAMTGGSGTFDLPADYAVTDSIYILAEDVNAQYLTDYASEMVKIVHADFNQVKGVSLSLDGKIGVNFHVSLSSKASTVVVNDPETEIEYPVRRIGMYKQDDGSYKIPVYVNATQAGMAVTLKILDENGEQLDLYNSNIKKLENGTVSYSVNEYIADSAKYADDEKVKALVKALDSYCKAATNYFTGSALAVETAGSASAADFDRFEPVLDGTKMALVLEAGTAIRIFYDGPETTAQLQGRSSPLLIQEKNGSKYFEIENIAAYELDHFHALKIGSKVLEFCPLSYGYLAYDLAADKPELITLVNALYAYYEAARAYQHSLAN